MGELEEFCYHYVLWFANSKMLCLREPNLPFTFMIVLPANAKLSPQISAALPFFSVCFFSFPYPIGSKNIILYFPLFFHGQVSLLPCLGCKYAVPLYIDTLTTRPHLMNLAD